MNPFDQADAFRKQSRSGFDQHEILTGRVYLALLAEKQIHSSYDVDTGRLPLIHQRLSNLVSLPHHIDRKNPAIFLAVRRVELESPLATIFSEMPVKSNHRHRVDIYGPAPRQSQLR